MAIPHIEHPEIPEIPPSVPGLKQLYTVAEAAKMLSLSRAHLYREMRAGRLDAVKSGRSTRLTARAIAKFIQLLEREARGFNR
ncbi:helix-turn-helix domain-containing protein [Actinocorallia longicatena]|uniref:Helix-turn-helix domain-containing protein n=1 Tax=Actinocorallia longicatena TaxID=111803 RepID=A0ABP6QM51_9ACTN